MEEVPPERVSSYGVIDPESLSEGGEYRIRGLVEKPPPEEAPSNLAIVADTSCPRPVFHTLERTTPGAKGEIQLTDGLALLLESHHLFAYRLNGERHDGGTPMGLLKASLARARSLPEYRRRCCGSHRSPHPSLVFWRIIMTTLKQSILDSAKELQQELEHPPGGNGLLPGLEAGRRRMVAAGAPVAHPRRPGGGIPKTVQGILDGSLPEITIIADETHLNDERQAMDMDQIRSALSEYFQTMESVLADATDEDIAGKATSCWFPLRNHREDRTAQNLIEGLFLNHCGTTWATCGTSGRDLGLD